MRTEDSALLHSILWKIELPRTILALIIYSPSMTSGVAMTVLWKIIFSGDEQGKVVTRKPILPTEKELEENSRSKSAKLRVFERMTPQK